MLHEPTIVSSSVGKANIHIGALFSVASPPTVLMLGFSGEFLRIIVRGESNIEQRVREAREKDRKYETYQQNLTTIVV